MGSTRRGAPASKPQESRIISDSHAKPSLPPKPVSQKRTRNPSFSAAMPPPPRPSPSVRPSGQKCWGRRSASWTLEEDAKLVELVKKESSTPPSITASKTWSRVASQLNNRTGKQCRERYLNQLKPGIRRDPWSSDEEAILRETHARIGNKWVAIAAHLPGRTDNCVKNHWNSMLRKRQRREAALKAAQAEVAATLGKSQGTSNEFDHRSDIDFSLRTGCATPSGVSSSCHDVPTSGFPSPYTASSPITPRRDSKLQISNLVAASTKEIPNWDVAQNIGQDSTRGAGFDYDQDCRGRNELNFSQDRGVVARMEMNRSTLHLVPCSPGAFAKESIIMRLPGQESSMVGLRGLPRNESFLTKEVVASPMQCIASSSQVPQIMQSVRPEGSQDVGVTQRQVRRSSRLLSCTTQENEGESSRVSDRMKGVQKRAISKSRVIEGVGVNALVALAAAASSVPPSPLTPESRYSTTSRSRSLSPDRRKVGGQGRCASGCGRVGVRMTRSKTAELFAGSVNETREDGEGSGGEQGE